MNSLFQGQSYKLHHPCFCQLTINLGLPSLSLFAHQLVNRLAALWLNYSIEEYGLLLSHVLFKRTGLGSIPPLSHLRQNQTLPPSKFLFQFVYTSITVLITRYSIYSITIIYLHGLLLSWTRTYFTIRTVCILVVPTLSTRSMHCQSSNIVC